MKKVIIVAGTRPEVVKMAPVYFALQQSEEIEPIFLSTAQHRQMLDQALAVFGIVPDFDLDLMQPGQNLMDLTARVLQAVGAFLEEHQPDAMLVQGDTTTVLASSIAAFYQRVPIGHVEAGLRTYNYDAPWPEEMNRRLADPISRWCFAPTERSAQNLIQERIAQSRVHVTGNTVIDALLWMRDQLNNRDISLEQICSECGIPKTFADAYLHSSERKWILVTGHRRESFGSGFENICRSIRMLVDTYPDLGVLYPVHLNPQVGEPVNRLLGKHDRIALVEPLAYESFIALMDRCYFVLSDSGGVQEEAPSLGKPVLVMRNTTERPEGVDVGTCKLVGTDPEVILREARVLLEDPAEYARRSALKNPYGDGTAARKIREVLERDLL